jgi:hypothetical protein
VFPEQLAAEGCGEASHLVRPSAHGGVDEIVVFNNKGYFRVTVTLWLYLGHIISDMKDVQTAHLLTAVVSVR